MASTDDIPPVPPVPESESPAPTAPVPPVEPPVVVVPEAVAPAAAPAPPQPTYPPQQEQTYVAPPVAPNPYVTPGTQQAYPGYRPMAPAGPRGLSIASMVCGIVGLVFAFVYIGFLPAVAAVILGHMSMKREPTAKGFWITGLITGYLGILGSVLLVLGTIVPFILFALFGAGLAFS